VISPPSAAEGSRESFGAPRAHLSRVQPKRKGDPPSRIALLESPLVSSRSPVTHGRGATTRSSRRELRSPEAPLLPPGGEERSSVRRTANRPASGDSVVVPAARRPEGRAVRTAWVGRSRRTIPIPRSSTRRLLTSSSRPGYRAPVTHPAHGPLPREPRLRQAGRLVRVGEDVSLTSPARREPPRPRAPLAKDAAPRAARTPASSRSPRRARERARLRPWTERAVWWAPGSLRRLALGRRHSRERAEELGRRPLSGPQRPLGYRSTRGVRARRRPRSTRPMSAAHGFRYQR
jgi:hypothetical protein